MSQNMPVPLLDLKAQYELIREEVEEAVKRVLESQRFILGPEVEALETEIAAYSQAAYGVGVSSGTDALLLALMVIGIEPGDEVITTPFSFFATAGSIARLGARPVFVDIDPGTCNIDPDGIEAAIGPRSKAIIPVHLYGQVAEMDPIMAIAEKHGLVVIEDAAQAIGAEYRGCRAGSMGHMSCFSFYPSKNLGGVGDGGMVTTSDPELDNRLRLFRNHGYRPKYRNAVVGGNFRLDGIQAAVLRVKLKYLDQWTAGRQRNAERYQQLFQEASLLDQAGDAGEIPVDGVRLLRRAPERRHIYNQFVIWCSQRDALRAFLTEQQIGNEIYYPVALHEQECFADLGYQHGDFPLSEAAAGATLALPIYPELTAAMQTRVVQAIADFYAS